MKTAEFSGEYRGKRRLPMRVRISRFLSERYVQREQPSYFADLVLWGLIIVLAMWPMFALAAAIETLR